MTTDEICIMHSDSLMPTANKIVGVCNANQCLTMAWLVIFMYLFILNAQAFMTMKECNYLILFQHIQLEQHQVLCCVTSKLTYIVLLGRNPFSEVVQVNEMGIKDTVKSC